MESFQSFVTQELVRIRADMRKQGTVLIDRQETPQDIVIQYRHGSNHDEALYMRQMLDAEAINRAKRAGLRP